MARSRDSDYRHDAVGPTQVRPGVPSDLLHLCLREDAREPARFLAWTNSICLLFLIVGILGLRSPSLRMQSSPPVADFMTVQWALPELERVIANSDPRQPAEPREATPTSELSAEPATEVPTIEGVAAILTPETIAFPVIAALDGPADALEGTAESGRHPYVPTPAHGLQTRSCRR